MPGGRAENFQAGLQRVVAFDELQFGLAAAEQHLEQALEMAVHGLESVEQPLAALFVQAEDALAQLGDRLFQVGALLLQAIEFGAQRLGLFLGAQIDAAEPFAVGLQLDDGLLGLVMGGQRLGRIDTGDGKALFGGAFERLADDAGKVAPLLARRLHPGLDTGAILARLAECALRLAQAALMVANRVLRFGEAGGGPAARLFGLAQLVEDFLPPRLDFGGQLGEFAHLLAHFAEAVMQGGDLLLGAAVAAQPAMALGGDGFEAGLARADLPLDAVGPRFDVGEGAALGGRWRHGSAASRASRSVAGASRRAARLRPRPAARRLHRGPRRSAWRPR